MQCDDEKHALDISRDMFVKIFIDLCKKGFFLSEAKEEANIISVNNKIKLVMTVPSFMGLLNRVTGKVPEKVKRWYQEGLK